MGIDKESVGGYYDAFCARTREARETMRQKWSIQDMADRLGVDYDTYLKWEIRSPMPHHLVEIFCDFTGVTIDWLMGKTPEIRVPLRVPAKGRKTRQRMVKRKARTITPKAKSEPNSA